MIPAREIAANFLIIELLLSPKIAYYIFQPSFSHVYMSRTIMKMILLIFLLFSPNYDLLTIMFILESYFYYIIHNVNILYLIHINDFTLFFLLFTIFINKIRQQTFYCLLPCLKILSLSELLIFIDFPHEEEASCFPSQLKVLMYYAKVLM